jgi:hypothetical protein
VNREHDAGNAALTIATLKTDFCCPLQTIRAVGRIVVGCSGRTNYKLRSTKCRASQLIGPTAMVTGVISERCEIEGRVSRAVSRAACDISLVAGTRVPQTPCGREVVVTRCAGKLRKRAASLLAPARPILYTCVARPEGELPGTTMVYCAMIDVYKARHRRSYVGETAI